MLGLRQRLPYLRGRVGEIADENERPLLSILLDRGSGRGARRVALTHRFFPFLDFCSIRSRWRSSASTCVDQKRRNGSSQSSTSLSGSGLSRYTSRWASTRASTKPASRSTRRCFETDVWGIRSRRSSSPTERSDDAKRPRISRRFGSARIANDDSIRRIYSLIHMPVKAHSSRPTFG